MGLELVRARPGITARDASAEFGVDPTSLYRIVRKLEGGGQVRKTGRSLEPIASRHLLRQNGSPCVADRHTSSRHARAAADDDA